jgi:hypothetical protein
MRRCGVKPMAAIRNKKRAKVFLVETRRRTASKQTSIRLRIFKTLAMGYLEHEEKRGHTLGAGMDIPPSIIETDLHIKFHTS